jgi:hypothetical protein
MHIHINAMDYGKVLTIPAEPNELVRSIKAKIDKALGGNQPEDIIDSLNYLGTTLDCSTPLSSYGIVDDSYLNMGRALIKQSPNNHESSSTPTPQSQSPHLVHHHPHCYQYPPTYAPPANPFYQSQYFPPQSYYQSPFYQNQYYPPQPYY